MEDFFTNYFAIIFLPLVFLLGVKLSRKEDLKNKSERDLYADVEEERKQKIRDEAEKFRLPGGRGGKRKSVSSGAFNWSGASEVFSLLRRGKRGGRYYLKKSKKTGEYYRKYF